MQKSRSLIVIAFLIAIICTFPFYPIELTENAIFNHFFVQAIPYSVGLFMIFIPICMTMAIRAKDETAMQCIRDKKENKRLQEIQKIYFTAKWRRADDSEGSKWMVSNFGETKWEEAILLIESELSGDIKREKHIIKNIEPGQRHLIHSNIPFRIEARCRVLLISNQAYKLEFADHWKPVFDWNSVSLKAAE